MEKKAEARGLRVAVTGATGNVGTSLLAALIDEPAVDSIVGIARRMPTMQMQSVEWRSLDVAEDDLSAAFDGVDVVVHLAWLIQPGREQDLVERVNVLGSRRVFDAARDAGAGAIVHASSVGAYSPGPKDRPVDESWPTAGIDSSFYSRHKAAAERILNDLEANSDMRIVRLRPSLIFKRESAVEQQRLFAGPFLPRIVIRRRMLPILPKSDRLRFQGVHADDVADAYRRAVVGEASGAFNIAAPDVLTMPRIAKLMNARAVGVPEAVLRQAADLTFRLRLQPSEPGWLDMALESPLMLCDRARDELGWEPAHSGLDAIHETIKGVGDGSDFPTPPLAIDDRLVRVG